MTRLTKKDVDVLRLVSQGYSRNQIAAQLEVTPSTVKNRIERIYLKLGITGKNRLESRNKLLTWLRKHTHPQRIL